MKIAFSREKVTPGTIRFKAEDEEAPVRTLYVAKSHQLARADRLFIEITAAD